METIGQRIARLRKGRAWTQARLAEETGIHPSYIALIEAGNRQPGTVICVKIADALDVSLDELIRGTSPNAAPAATKNGLIEAVPVVAAQAAR